MTTEPTSTTSPTVKAALVEAGKNLDEFVDNDVPVSWGEPKFPTRAYAYAGSTLTDQGQWATQGTGGFREERYEVLFHIVVEEPGGEAEEVENSALRLLAALETYLRDHSDLGVDGVVNVELASWRLDPYFTDDGRGAEIEAHVAVQAYLAN